MPDNSAESAGVIETGESGEWRDKPGFMLKTDGDNKYIWLLTWWENEEQSCSDAVFLEKSK